MQTLFLDAFKRKVGANADVFADARFKEVRKDRALARLALFGALQHWKALHDLTPGQITTIIDASPLIVGRNGRRELRRVRNLDEIGLFVERNHDSWKRGAFVAAQVWSLAYGSEGKPDYRFFYNSQVTREDMKLFLQVNALAAGGQFLEKDAPFLWRAMHACGQGLSRDARRAVVAGEFDRCGGVNLELMGEIQRAVPPLAGLDYRFREDSFLGGSSLDDMQRRSRGQIGRGTAESLGGFLRRVPYGPFVVKVANRFVEDNSFVDDFLGAALKGYERSLETYVPIVVPARSVLDVARETGMDLFNRTGQVVEGGIRGEFVCIRFAAYASEQYMRKYLLEQCNFVAGGEVDAEEKAVERILRSKAERVQEDTPGMPWASAVEIACGELQGDAGNKRDTAALARAAARVVHGRGLFVSLDASLDPTESGEGLHNMIADATEFLPDDEKEEVLRDAPAVAEDPFGTARAELEENEGGARDRILSLYEEVYSSILECRAPSVRVFDMLAEPGTPFPASPAVRVLNADVHHACDTKDAVAFEKSVDLIEKAGSGSLVFWTTDGNTAPERLTDRFCEQVLQAGINI